MSAKSEELEHDRPNPPRRGLRKGLYLIPSAFTAANIAMGFLSVMSSLRGFQLLGGANPDVMGARGQFDTAAIAIGFHLNRAPGCDCDYRNSRRNASARPEQGQDQRTRGQVPEQSSSNQPRDRAVCH